MSIRFDGRVVVITMIIEKYRDITNPEGATPFIDAQEEFASVSW